MLISFNWLKQYLNLSDSVTPEEVALKLKNSTVEVEGIQKQGENLNKIVVGRIIKVEKHPNADSLLLCDVEIQNEVLKIVCGGSNVRENMLVAVAPAGAMVKWHGQGDLVELKNVEIRGVKSFGMICASSEIGLGEMFPAKEEKEILDLTNFPPTRGEGRGEGVIVGQPLAEVLGLNDVVFEIDNKSLSNRPDLFGHYGIAREVATLFATELGGYSPPVFKPSKELKIKVQIEDKKLCLRYMAIGIGNVKVSESPAWLKQRLSAVGLRSINNIVDITNFVMLDLGQPMHAFDQSKVKSQKSKVAIEVRKAKAGEKMITLDEQMRELVDTDIVIADEEKILALAGVMGGQGSGVDKETTEIIFEAADFDAGTIRKTSTRLGLRTDSSVRFEKALDPNLCALALRRAVQLILELCPEAKIISNLVDEKDFFLHQGPIDLPFTWLDKKIGVKIDSLEVGKILTRLGFEIKVKKDGLSVKIPTWRATKDITIAEDLVEEIVRIYGYEKINGSLPLFPIMPPERNKLRLLERKVKNILAREFGFSEVYNYSFVSPLWLEKLGIDISQESNIELANPMAKDRPYLRSSLSPGLLENLTDNLHRFDSVKIFEIGKIFAPHEPGLRASKNSDELLPRQDLLLGMAYSAKQDDVPFYTVAETITAVLHELGVEIALQDCADDGKKAPFVHSGRCVRLICGGESVGIIAEVHPVYAERLGIVGHAAVAELDLEKILPFLQSVHQYQPIGLYPTVARDIAFLVSSEITHQTIVDKIIGLDPLIQSVELFDVFVGKNIPVGKKSMAYHLMYQSKEKTLTTEEIDLIHDKVEKMLAKEFGAELRK